ncbi:MAG: hypothetical protein ACYC2H_11180 [Thermoplasmatota archaeon]
MIRFAAAGFAMFVLAGCMTGTPDNPDSDNAATTQTFSQTSSSTRSVVPDQPGPDEGNSTVPTHMSLTDCIELDLVVYGPTALFSEPMPPGWEESTDEAATELFLRLYDCQKIAFGPFERGPVTMLAEVHGSLDAPDSCLENHPSDFEAYAWLSSWWFSDPDVAQWVKDTYGGNVQYGEFKLDRQATPGSDSYKWSWRVPGGGWSYLTMHDAAIDDAHPSSLIESWFWFNGKGITYMDASITSMSDDTSSPALEGFMAPPMLYARATGQGQFAALPGWYPSSGFEGDLERFSDLECKVPA